MDKKTGIIIAIIIAIFGVAIGIGISQRGEAPEYLSTIIAPSAESGNLPENVEGNPDAPILIFEYADYQCEGCASINPKLNQLVEDYDGKVAVVYRNYVQSYHANGTAAASAANAAAIQGYWQEFKDLLFANQNDWYYADVSARQEQFEKYFATASAGKGDIDKFRLDMNSEAVSQKIAFDRKLSEERKLSYTPLIYLGKTKIDQSEMGANFIENMHTKIDALLQEMGE